MESKDQDNIQYDKSPVDKYGCLKQQSNYSLSSLNDKGSSGSNTTEGSQEGSPKKQVRKWHKAVKMSKMCEKLHVKIEIDLNFNRVKLYLGVG